MHFDLSDFEKSVEKPRTLKARIRELMPVIEELRGKGYFLYVIFEYLKKKQILSGSKKTFYYHYYWFRNHPDDWRMVVDDKTWKPTIISAGDFGKEREEPRRGRSDIERDYTADELLADKIFASKR